MLCAPGRFDESHRCRLSLRKPLPSASTAGARAASARAEPGGKVTLAARTAKEIEEAAAAIRARGQKAEPLILDVRDVEQVQAAISAAEPFDILFNNAGT